MGRCISLTACYRHPARLRSPAPKGDKGDRGESIRGPKGDPGEIVYLGDPEMAEAIKKLHIRLVNTHAAMVLALEDASRLKDPGQRSIVMSSLQILKSNAGI